MNLKNIGIFAALVVLASLVSNQIKIPSYSAGQGYLTLDVVSVVLCLLSGFLGYYVTRKTFSYLNVIAGSLIGLFVYPIDTVYLLFTGTLANVSPFILTVLAVLLGVFLGKQMFRKQHGE